MSIATRRLAAGVAAVALVSALAGPALAVDPDVALPPRLADLKLAEPVTEGASIERGLRDASGPQLVIVRLTEKPVATGGKAQKPKVAAQQAKVVRSLKGLDKGARQIATTKVALNAVFVRADAEALVELAADPNVVSINRVRNYELDLSETVPYIGGSAVQAAGFDGTGVKVAVLDSGIDYTHAALGGSGNPADFAGNDPTVIEAGTFPTAKVVAGYDFVGSDWPNTPEAPDPDPIDDGPDGGHGTHVADIIAGAQGVAPGASLYAVKVCSSVSTSCSGIALIQGMDFALDPNGDGDLSDRSTSSTCRSARRTARRSTTTSRRPSRTRRRPAC
jgi:subtilisin family serine protease